MTSSAQYIAVAHHYCTPYEYSAVFANEADAHAWAEHERKYGAIVYINRIHTV